MGPARHAVRGVFGSRAMSAPILERIRKADNLPSLPAVTLEVMELIRAGEASAEEIAEVIQRDPALAARVLKMVNSAFFALSSEVVSVKHAVTLLGLRTVKVMILGFSVVELGHGTEHDGFDYDAYWRRSLCTAVAARLLAHAAAPKLKEEAFIGGLLADVGMLAAHRCARELYAPVLAEWAKLGHPEIEVELRLLGVSHATMSRELLATWGLPELLYGAVGAHQGEGIENLSGTARQLAGILAGADAVAGVFCGVVPPDRIAQAKAACSHASGVGGPMLDHVLLALDASVQEVAALLDLKIAPTVSYAQMQSEAGKQLAQLTIEAEQETAGYRQSMTNAGEIQRRILPARAPEVPGCRFASRYVPSERVSGDFYDFIPAHGGKLGVVIGDVSGHGIVAAVTMGVAKKLLQMGLRSSADPARSLRIANQELFLDLQRTVFVTACAGVYDPADRMFRFCRAGHNPVIVYHPDRGPRPVRFEPPGMALGWDDGTQFNATLGLNTLPMRPGDLLFLYTDGISEAMNPQGEEFGLDRICDLLERHYSADPEETLDQMLEGLTAFRKERPQEDDITLLAMRVL